MLRGLAVIPAAAVVASCDRTADSTPTTTPKPRAKGRRFVNPPELFADEAYTTVIRVGSHVYITAQVPTDTEGNILFAGDVAEQTRQVWRNIEIAMKSVGGKLTDVVQCLTHVTKREYFPIVAHVRSEVFPVNPPTTSRPILVAALSGVGDVPVSISVIGYIDD